MSGGLQCFKFGLYRKLKDPESADPNDVCAERNGILDGCFFCICLMVDEKVGGKEDYCFLIQKQVRERDRCG